jgi:PEP-CTERM motif-containing protein
MKSSVGLILIAAGLAHASTILLQSGVSDDEFNNITTTNVVLNDLEPKWTPGQDGAQWISFEDTGWNSGTMSAVNTVPNSTGESDPNAIFTQTFTDTNSPLDLTITVWADDSAVLFLDGVQVGPNANFNQISGDFCAPTGITCDGPGTTYTINGLAAGLHTLTFDVYQIGSGSFGLMYEGTVTDSANPSVPEPGSYMLVGAGLTALALLRFKRAF